MNQHTFQMYLNILCFMIMSFNFCYSFFMFNFLKCPSFIFLLFYLLWKKKNKTHFTSKDAYEVPRGHSCSAAMAKAKWRLSSSDWLMLCFPAIFTTPYYLLPYLLHTFHHLATLGGMWNCEPWFIDSILSLLDNFCDLSHWVKSKSS